MSRPQPHALKPGPAAAPPTPGATRGRLIVGPWGPPRVLSLGCSRDAAAFALDALAAYAPQIDATAHYARQHDRLSPDDIVVVLGAGSCGPLPDGSTVVMQRRWYEEHWTRQKAPLRPCPRGRIVVVVVDGRGGRGVACSYAPPRLPKGPRRPS